MVPDMSNSISRKEREKTRHRMEILESAEELFAEKGFHRTTVEDVAERAEFSVGTLYNFFSSKEELYQSLLKERCQQISDEANLALDQATEPIATIKMYIQAKIDIFTKYYAFTKLYTRERMGDRFSNNELWREIVAPLYEKIRDRVISAIQGGIEKGLFLPDICPRDYYIALEGLTDGYMYDWLMNPDSTTFKEKYDIMLTLFFKGVEKRP